MITIDDLPNEILLEIFLYFNVIERQRFEQVCKRWQAIIRQKLRSSIRKLKFVVKTRYSQRRNTKDRIINGIHYNTHDLSHLESLLNIFDGNLTKFEYENRIHNNADTSDVVFKLLKQNKNLNSVRIICRDEFELVKFVKCLPTDNLEHLSILLSNISSKPPITELIDATNDTLLKVRELKFFHANTAVSQSTLKTLASIETLKSLHLELGDLSGFNNELLEIGKLSDLEALTIHYSKDITNNVVIGLMESCRKLRALQLSHCDKLKAIGLNIITTLPNLRFLNMLGTKMNETFINNLINIAEFQCDINFLGHSSNGLLRFVKRSPKFAGYIFRSKSNDDANELLYELFYRVNQPPLNCTRNLFDLEWNKIFGIQQEYDY